MKRATTREGAIPVHADALDRRGPKSLASQLHDFLRSVILRGDLPPLTRLPSTRAFARSLHVSRNTILGAYERLVLEGLIVGRRGSGTRVSDRLAHAEMLGAPKLSARRLLRAAQYPTRTLRVLDPDGNVISLQ